MVDMERALRNHHMLCVALAFAAGIILSCCFNLGNLAGISIIILGAGLYLLFTFLPANPQLIWRFRKLHLIWISICFLGAGITAYSLDRPDSLPDFFFEDECQVRGVVENYSTGAYGMNLLIKVSQIRCDAASSTFRPHNLRISATIPAAGVNVGSEVSFKGMLKKGGFPDFSFYPVRTHSGGKYGATLHTTLGEKELAITGYRSSLKSRMSRLRCRIETVIEHTHIQKNTQNFLIAILLGDKTALDPTVRESFADAGVAHILALSGMHMAIIAGIFFFLLYPLNLTGRFRWRVAVAVLFVWIYTMLTGTGASSVRAAIMMTYMAAGIILERKLFTLNSIGAAALTILVFSPCSLFDIGFQLSFAAVISLTLFTETLNPIDHLRHPVLYRGCELIAATTAATFGTWILSAYYFGRFPLSFLPSNIIILPLLPFIMTASLIFVVTSAFGFEIHPLGNFLNIIYNNISLLIHQLGNGTSADVQVGMESVVTWIAGIVLLGIYLAGRKGRYLGAGIMMLTLSLIFIPLNKSEIPDNSFIICNEHHRIALTLVRDGKESICRFGTQRFTLLKIGGKRVMAMDCPVESRAISGCRCDYLIIGGNYKGEIEELCLRLKPGCVVIHPSVSKKKEARLLASLHKAGVRHHSLRRLKSLKVIA